VVLLVLVSSNILHLLAIIVVQLVICRFLLTQIDGTVLSQMVFLDESDYFFVLVYFLYSFGEIEVGGCSCFFGLHDTADRSVEILSLCQCFMGICVTQVDCTSDLVDF